MDQQTVNTIAGQLHDALINRRVIDPITDTYADVSIPDAYRISLKFLEQRLAAGERIIGKKIGVTSAAVMDMLNVHQPDFGFLTDAMQFGSEMPISQLLIQPRAEGELAFRLGGTLQGPGITEADVIAATEAVFPCFEVVDSRIESWRIKIQDTVADNASCGLFAYNDSAGINPSATDLAALSMEVEKNGTVISTGKGSAAMGNPITCVAWLANTLGEFGISLDAGDIILSGSLVPLEPVVPGDVMTVRVLGVGECTVNFT